MIISLTSLTLHNLRSYSSFVLAFEQPALTIIGQNASGKTTILEAIYLATTGNSFRAQQISDLIAFNAELGRVQAVIAEDTIEVMVTRGMVQGKRTLGRLFSVNGIRRRKQDATSRVFPVLFRPEDMRLIEGSTGRRRAFLDDALQVLHPEYARALKTYEQTLKRRNKLLTQVKLGEQPATSLTYWNAGVLKHGEVLQKFRRDFLQQCIAADFALPFTVTYDPSVISEERQKQYLPREIASGHSLIGPHRDDFFVSLPIGGEARNIADFGSRGQQRMAVLWMKLCELRYAERLGMPVLLLLDDILSELDADSKQHALALIPQYQSIITSTESETIEIVRKVQPLLQELKTAAQE